MVTWSRPAKSDLKQIHDDIVEVIGVIHGKRDFSSGDLDLLRS